MRLSGVLLALPAMASAQFLAAPGSPFGASYGLTQPGVIAEGDFNGDGKLDLAVANGPNVAVLLGDGLGGFSVAPGSPFAVSTSVSYVAAGDFNGDGKLDLITANYDDNTVLLLLGNGSGGFSMAPGIPFPAGMGPETVAVGDFNGDGKLDVAVSNFLGMTVAVLLGNGKGDFSFAPGSPISFATDPGFLTVGDFNGDGIPDLAVANGINGATTIAILLGNGSGEFNAAAGSPYAVGGGASFMAVGDFNGDGKLDLAVTNEFGTLTVLLGNGRGGFSDAPGSPIQLGSAPLMIAAADFNADGKLDLAIANALDNTVSILLGDGRGGFSAAPGTPIPVGSDPEFLAAGDFNGDGKPDLAISDYLGGGVVLLLNKYPGKSIVQPPFGSFDTPVNGQTGAAGEVNIGGWALSRIPVSVKIWRDPVANEPAAGNGLVFVEDTTFIAGTRPDVAALYPGYLNSGAAGWGAQLLSNELPNSSGSGAIGNGTYVLHALATDTAGNTSDLGAHTITVNNAASVLPFGAIDTPAAGATISGTAYVNFGWALTPKPGSIPINGSTITVFIDKKPVGHPVYDNPRSDIQTLFPGYANSNGAVGYLRIDTTTLTNGLHQIAWSVADNAGHTTGIGSRYFTVQN